jgi:glycosyltransferase involved in cell wall biosynthesis
VNTQDINPKATVPDTKKKLGLYLGVLPNAGGMFQYSQCLLEALLSMQGQHLDIVIAYGDDSWEHVLERYGIQGIRLQHWAFGEKVAKLFMASLMSVDLARALSRYFNPLVAELSSFRCDLWIFPAQDALSWQVAFPAIATVHDLMHRYERQFPEAGTWWRYWMREHRFCNLANATTAVLVDSETGRQHVIESYATSSTRIFPLPYIAPKYISDNAERSDFDACYQLPEKFFFYPAQFWPHKNHIRLLEALALAQESCPDMMLILSGSTRHRYEKIKAHAHTLGLETSVRFVGYVPDLDLAGFYRRARGLVMPTFFGPTNIPPLEAMTCGCPVLISGTYGMPEQCGDAALYFSPDSVQEIAQAMIQLWQDDKTHSRLSQNGKRKIASWSQLQFNHRFAAIINQVFSISTTHQLLNRASKVSEEV